MNAETKECPECGETILAIAKKCKHCKSDISPQPEPIGAFRLAYQTSADVSGASIDETDRTPVFSGLLVALAPLVALVLQHAAAVGVHLDAGMTWVIWLLINTGTCAFDRQVLRAVGYDTEALSRWTMFLVPVYLYKRGKVCNPSFLLVWILCLIVPSLVPSHATRGLAAATEDNRTVVTRYVGDTFRTDSFEITVPGAKTAKWLGDTDVLSRPAEGGIYVLVGWTYVNKSQKPVSAFSAPTVHLLAPDGIKYDADVGASALLASRVPQINAKVLSDVNPGIRINDASVFEVSRQAFDEAKWRILVEADGEEFVVGFARPAEMPKTDRTKASNSELQPTQAVQDQLASRVSPTAAPQIDPASYIGIFEAPPDRVLRVVSASADGKTLAFALSIGVASGESACEEGVVDCLAIKGVAVATSADEFRSDASHCHVVIAPNADAIAIREVSGYCGVGSGNSHQLGRAMGVYRRGSNVDSPARHRAAETEQRAAKELDDITSKDESDRPNPSDMTEEKQLQELYVIAHSPSSERSDNRMRLLCQSLGMYTGKYQIKDEAIMAGCPRVRPL